MTTVTTRTPDLTVTAGELQLHCREWGDPGDPGVLLLHGLTGNAWEWDPIAADLSRRHHVVAVDQRGHGASARADDYAAERMAEDIGAVIEALRLDRAAIVGHSMGAINGLLFAAANPELVERLAIVDIGPESLGPGAVAGWRASLRAAARTSYAAPAEAVAEWQAGNPRARAPELRRFIDSNLSEGEDGRWRWRFDAAGLESFLDQVPSEDALWAALRRLESPTLVVRGQHSDALSAATAERMTAELARGALVDIADGAHDLTVEQPSALGRVLDEFLAQA